MFRTAIATFMALTLSLPVMAAELITKTSPHSVPETINRLEAAVTTAGATIFARIDHTAGGQEVGMELRPTTLLIFGNPKLGTPAMQANQTAGLDLPLRVLAYADDNEVVHLVYHDPTSLAEDHGLPIDAEYLKMMTGALNKLTSKAVAAN